MDRQAPGILTQQHLGHKHILEQNLKTYALVWQNHMVSVGPS